MTTADPDPNSDLGVDPAPLPPRVLVTLLVQLADAPPPPPPPELVEWIEQWSRTGVPPPRRRNPAAEQCRAVQRTRGFGWCSISGGSGRRYG